MAAADDRSKRRKIVAFKDGNADDFCLAKDCIKLHLISTREEFQEGHKTFSPDFLEEHFGESGRIYGYKGLKVDIWFHSSSFHVYADVEYDALVPVSGKRKPQTNIDAMLKEIFGAALVENRDLFLRQLTTYSKDFSDLLSRHGERLANWQAPSESTSDIVKHNQIFRLEITNPEVREWHQRLNPLILWLVEGARCIDPDPRWEVYLAVETVQERHKVTGLCNVYRFFHYPDSTRLRISQILVFPPFQNRQYGFHLVNTVNDVAIKQGCYDVTMEDPSDRLQKLRDCMDVVRLLSCPPVVCGVKAAVETIAGETNGNVVKNSGLLLSSAALTCMVRERFKISKSQFKRCWEVMILLHMGPGHLPAFRELMSAKLCGEYFENKENKEVSSSRKKRVVDTENEHDSSKTFVMMRFKHGSGSEDGGGDVGSSQDDSSLHEEVDQEKRDEALKELLQERDKQIMEVVKKVAALCKKHNVPAQFDPLVWL